MRQTSGLSAARFSDRWTDRRGQRAAIHPLLLRAAAVGIGLLLALLVAELALRVSGRTAGARSLPLTYASGNIDRLASGQVWVTFDADLGWVPTPRFDRESGGVRYHHNRDGLRADHTYTQAPRAGIRRLAAYGESFTYCERVDLADCWTDQLEKQLPDTEVLNFGVPAWGPDQAWLRYQRGGAAWQPCAVLIGYMVENINRVVNRFRPFYYPNEDIVLAKPRFVLEGDSPEVLPIPTRQPDDLKDPVWVETNLGPRDAWYFPGMFVANPLDRLELGRLVRTAAYRDGGLRERESWTATNAQRRYRPGTEPFEVTLAVLAGFAEQVRADGATPVVVVFPTDDELIIARDRGAKPHAPLLDALGQRGIPTIDLTDELGEAARGADLKELVVGHYRPQGNAVVARTLASRLPGLSTATCGSG